MSEDASVESRLSSLLSAITSVASSLMPNVIDVQQLQRLILSLIQMPTTEQQRDVATNQQTQVGDPRLQSRRERHRQTERSV